MEIFINGQNNFEFSKRGYELKFKHSQKSVKKSFQNSF